ncbi:hypothetical protein PIB30_022568 [Stylosanthes scabra]|uniref:Uncharacterized protein n=1 Tax=Stylosanthes scabra TaxID=79078 RepID=A0ABU6Y9M3_9FABA|nr:hypothetical protein [Stylosanthes scabra]
MESKESGQKAKNSPIQCRSRARALPMACPRFPLLNEEVSVGGAPALSDGTPAPPHFVMPKIRTPHARAVEVTRPRDGSRTHLNEGYFGDFTFPGQGPSISQALFDLYWGGGTAET